ncbi:DUF2905 family protein [Oxalobacteraceae bacterium R-40]|uniref:DUF2905 family protein n=1 Tax=Keguizhuia sedimenti TaxID=3064264 RepID=A0ABU1BPR5_9BURK|nr:DUF2905 family protein [Oxalobacteraceae bacterium R-40]
MIRWVAVIFIGLLVFSALFPGLMRLGVGRVPGDVRFKLFGLMLCLPFGSTIVWSAVAFLVAEIVHRTCLFC